MPNLRMTNQILAVAIEGITEAVEGVEDRKLTREEIDRLTEEIATTGELADALTGLTERFQHELELLARSGQLHLPAARPQALPAPRIDIAPLTDTADQPAAELIPFKLPETETIAELIRQGKAIPEATTEAMQVITRITPAIGLTGLTPDEIKILAAYTETIQDSPRNVLVEHLTDFAHLVVRAGKRVGVDARAIRAAQEIVQRDRDQRGPYTPNHETLVLLEQAILQCAKSLLDRSMDPELLDPTGKLAMFASEASGNSFREGQRGEEAAATILVLQEIQRIDATSRQPQQVETLSKAFGELIQFHAELMMKLKKAGNSLQDFASDKTSELINEVRFLKSVTAYMYRFGRITPKQRQTGLEVFHNYRSIMEFLVNSNETLCEILITPLNRPDEPSNSLITELTLRLDDHRQGETRANMRRQGIKFNFTTLNQILLQMGYTHPQTAPQIDARTSSLLKRGDNQALTALMDKYRAMSADDREEVRTRVLNTIEEGEAIVVNQCFDIMDQYVA